MRKFKILILLCLIPFLFAFNLTSTQQSAVKTTDTDAVFNGRGYFAGIMVTTDGTNACTVVIYDSATVAAGTIKLMPDWIVTTSSSKRAATLSMDPPLEYFNGVSVDITCSGDCSYVVYRAK